MLVRVRFLRSVREQRRLKNRRARRLEAAPPHTSPFAGETAGMPDGPMPAVPMESSPVGRPHVFFAESPSTTKQSDSPGSTPPGIGTGSTVTSDDTYRRDKSPSRASSTTPSARSAKRRSWASVLSSISSGISSLARSSSSASSKNANMNASSANPALSRMTRDDFMAHLQEKPRKGLKGLNKQVTVGLFKPKYSIVDPTTEDLNAALVRMCCSAYVGSHSGCVHERLSRAIDDQKTTGPDFRHFTVTDEEANMVDQFGNSLLHVAARWGARVSLMLLILRHTDEVQMVNHRGETFLHVFDPPDAPPMRPASFLNLVRNLRSRGFDFCQRDVDRHTFLHRMVVRKGFPIETLYYVFREVGHGAARFLVANKSASGDRLWHSVRRNLERTAPKLPRIFGDEVEFIRRYLPEFCDSKAPSTAGTSTCGSDSTISLHPAETSFDPNDSSAQHVRRTPIMRLLRRAAAGRGLSDQELGAKLESVYQAASKQQPGFDRRNYLLKRDTEGNTALHYAAEFGLVLAVQFLCTKGAGVNVFNNCGNTPLQLVKFAIQRTDVGSDIHMEARYLRCAVLLLEQGAFDQSKLVSDRSSIYPYDVFDGSERSIGNLVRQGVASQCRGLHLLTSSATHHAPAYADAFGHDGHHGQRRDGSSNPMSLTFHTSVLS